MVVVVTCTTRGKKKAAAGLRLVGEKERKRQQRSAELQRVKSTTIGTNGISRNGSMHIEKRERAGETGANGR